MFEAPLAWLRSQFGRTEAAEPDPDSERAVKLPADELDLEGTADSESETE